MTNQPTKVFLSYTERSSEDRIIADKIKSALKLIGFDIWFASERIPGGTDYREYILPAIENIEIFVIVASLQALNSKEVLIELDEAYRQKKRIIPFLVPSFSFDEIFSLPANVKHCIISAQVIDAHKDTLDTNIQFLIDSITQPIEGFVSDHGIYSENAKIEKIKKAIEKGDFFEAETILEEFNAYVGDKKFFQLARIIVNYSKNEIRDYSIDFIESDLKLLLQMVKSDQYQTISLMIIYFILICFFDRNCMISPIGSAKEVAKQYGQPLLSFRERKLLKHLKKCKNFDINYYALF